MLSSCTTAPIKQPDSNLNTPPEGRIRFQPDVTTCSKDEQDIILKAEAKVLDTINSQCFYDFMAARKLEETEGKTNDQVILNIRTYGGMVPISMYYKRFTSAVAYRTPPYPTIYLNRRNFNSHTKLCHWGSTMMHEASHVIGYGHAFRNPSDYSVPYSINAAFEECCKHDDTK